MESVGRKSRPRRSFTPEFKAEIVELCQRGVRSVGQVARDFDLTETAVREWVKQAERDAGTRDDGGLTSDERKQLAQLRKENRRGAEPQSGGRRPPFPIRAPPRGRTGSAGTSPPTRPSSTPGGAPTSPTSPLGRAGSTSPR